MTRRERLNRIIEWFEPRRSALTFERLFAKHGTAILTDAALEEYARGCIVNYKFSQKLNRQNRALRAKATGEASDDIPAANMYRWRETTDGIYRSLGDGKWWDMRGTDVVGESVVDKHLETHCGVGIVVVERTEDLPESDIPDRMVW